MNEHVKSIALTLPTDKADEIPSSRSFKVIAACSLGNALEWFDFAAYTMFATTIARVFFPTGSEATSLLAAFATYAVGFLVRPLGAVLLGSYADRAGRKAALSLTILLMAAGTSIIAFTPGFNTIGIAAPILIVIARMLQGLSAGGEIGSAVSFLVEHASPDKRGFFAAWQQASIGFFHILAGLIGFLISQGLSTEQIESWGWRIPFLIGLCIVPVGLYIRRRLDETPLFKSSHAAEAENTPALSLVHRHFKALAIGIGLVMVWTVSAQLANYMPTYTVRELGMPRSAAFIGIFVLGLIYLLAPLIGTWSDRIGRRRIMMAASGGMLVLSYPCFAFLAAHPTTPVLTAILVIQAVLLVLYSAPATAALAELFPTAVRSTGIALSYNISVTLFGGFTPAISVMLAQLTGNKAALAFYFAAAASMSLLSLYLMEDRSQLRHLQ